MMRAIVSLGSNLGAREEYLSRALVALAQLPGTRLKSKSSIIETDPVDVPDDCRELKFLNQIAVFETNLSAETFSDEMHKIEDNLGRVRTRVNGPRTIDIDLIDFDGITINTPSLTLPHPRASKRSFVLDPLKELGISPNFDS